MRRKGGTEPAPVAKRRYPFHFGRVSGTFDGSGESLIKESVALGAAGGTVLRADYEENGMRHYRLVTAIEGKPSNAVFYYGGMALIKYDSNNELVSDEGKKPMARTTTAPAANTSPVDGEKRHVFVFRGITGYFNGKADTLLANVLSMGAPYPQHGEPVYVPLPNNKTATFYFVYDKTKRNNPVTRGYGISKEQPQALPPVKAQDAASQFSMNAQPPAPPTPNPAPAPAPVTSAQAQGTSKPKQQRQQAPPTPPPAPADMDDLEEEGEPEQETESSEVQPVEGEVGIVDKLLDSLFQVLTSSQTLAETIFELLPDGEGEDYTIVADVHKLVTDALTRLGG